METVDNNELPIVKTSNKIAGPQGRIKIVFQETVFYIYPDHTVKTDDSKMQLIYADKWVNDQRIRALQNKVVTVYEDYNINFAQWIKSKHPEAKIDYSEYTIPDYAAFSEKTGIVY